MGKEVYKGPLAPSPVWDEYVATAQSVCREDLRATHAALYLKLQRADLLHFVPTRSEQRERAYTPVAFQEHKSHDVTFERPAGWLTLKELYAELLMLGRAAGLGESFTAAYTTLYNYAAIVRAASDASQSVKWRETKTKSVWCHSPKVQRDVMLHFASTYPYFRPSHGERERFEAVVRKHYSNI